MPSNPYEPPRSRPEVFRCPYWLTLLVVGVIQASNGIGLGMSVDTVGPLQPSAYYLVGVVVVSWGFLRGRRSQRLAVTLSATWLLGVLAYFAFLAFSRTSLTPNRMAFIMLGIMPWGCTWLFLGRFAK